MRLEQLSEKDYKKFNENLLPGTEHVLGVRMPKLRTLAKEVAKEDFRTYLDEAHEKISADQGSYHEEIMLEGLVIAYAKMELEERFFYLDRFVPKILDEAHEKISADQGSYHEEIMLEGLVIAYAKMELEERFFYLDRFVPKIHNWAVCDCCSNTYKFMEKYQEESFAYIDKYLHSQREYELRFGMQQYL